MNYKEIDHKISLKTVLTSILTAIFLHILFPKAQLFATPSDAIFFAGMTTSLLGLVSILVAKSRHHYYRHLKEKFAGKRHDDAIYDAEEKKREEHALLSFAVLEGGIVAILLSMILLLLPS